MLPLKRNNTINILGVHIDIILIDEILEKIMFLISNYQKAIISYSNVHAINLSFDISWFKSYLNESVINFCDGYGITLAANILKQPVPYRFTPPDWIDDLFQLCVAHHYKVFLLGGNPGITQKIKNDYSKKMPGLKIVGIDHGYFNKEINSKENQEIVNKINGVSPDILLVGFGMPLQERWIMENYDQINVKVFMPVGALFDYMTGNVKRAPIWMTDHGLEWLGRLVIEPKRLWRRYIFGNPKFFYRVLLQKFGLLKFGE